MRNTRKQAAAQESVAVLLSIIWTMCACLPAVAEEDEKKAKQAPCVSATAVVAEGRESPADKSKLARQHSVYAKIVLPMKEPGEAGHPVVEPWIAKELRKRGEAELRAVTHWVRLAEEGEELADIWNATVDGKGWGCPVSGRVERTTDGEVRARLPGWSPFGAEIKGSTLPAECGSRRIAVVDTGRGDESSRAYVALFVGKRKGRTK